MSNFKYPRPAGFVPTAREVRNSGMQSSIPGFAQGGMVRRNTALVDRSEPVTELDREGGGKSPLRPGYSRGGKAKKKYAEGGKVGSAKGLMEWAVGSKETKRRASESNKGSPRSRRIREWAEQAEIKEPIKKAEGGKVGALKAAAKPARDKMAQNLRSQRKSNRADRMAWKDKSDMASIKEEVGDMKGYAEGGKVGALGAAIKRMPAVAGARKMAADDMRTMRRSNPEAAKDAARVVKSSRRAQGRPFAEGGKVGKLKKVADGMKMPEGRANLLRERAIKPRPRDINEPVPVGGMASKSNRRAASQKLAFGGK